MRFLLNTLLCFVTINAAAQQQYHYKIDLVNVNDDKVAVKLKTPVITETEILFSFPRVIPGSYSNKSYGRFIESFKAFDAEGKQLKSKRANDNQYLIKEANKLAAIEYLVNDSWDEHDKKDHIFEPGGSNIEAGKDFVINNFAFFGYFEGYKQFPFEIEVTKPDFMYGATVLASRKISATTDIITADNFFHLSDNPVLYCRPDTVSFTAANMVVNVAVYSATGKIKSSQVVEYLKPMATALQGFFGTLPVDKYDFLFFFDEVGNLIRGKNKDGGFGALEHNYCSFYYLPEIGFEPKLKSMVSDVTSHEFLHILTPLNVHSEQIENFDFVNPEMSQHLWMYEGVTEYFSNLVQLQSGIMTEEKFFDEMRSKINGSAKYGDFSMTEMSKRVLEDKFQEKYGSVYNKGALIAFFLDLYIIEKTNGQKNLKWVMNALKEKYGKSKPFADDKLLDEIVTLTDPAIKIYIDNYIAGKETLPYEKALSLIAYDYETEKDVSGYYFAGRLNAKFDDKENSFVFIEVESNALNIRNGDVILAIAGTPVDQQNISGLMDEYLFENTKHPAASITVKRDGKELVLSGDLYKAHKVMKNYIGPSEHTNAYQQRNKDVWLGKK